MSVAPRTETAGRHLYGVGPVADAAGISMRPHRAANMLSRLEYILYRVVIVPLIAFLPARLAYGIACMHGDWNYRIDVSKRELIMRNLVDVLGEQLRPQDRARVSRDCFRRLSCDVVDFMRLAGKGRALMRLVEVRGLEHVQAALAAGKGAIICTSHCGQTTGACSLLGAYGLPVTGVGNWPSTDDPTLSWIGRLALQYLYVRPLAHHRRRPNIEPGKAGVLAAIQIAEVLRANEVVWIPIDTPLLDPKDQARTIQVDFLGRQARLLPGSVNVAKRTGATVLVGVMRRSTDWRHQVLEISPPVPVDGDIETAFKSCVAQVEEATYQNLAHWVFWESRQVLVNLGLVPGEVVKSPLFWDLHPTRRVVPARQTEPSVELNQSAH